MGKDTPQQPAAPDPVATANAQAQANTTAAISQANLNRIDQYTPQGSIQYSQTGTNADGTPKYAQTQTYSPGQQALYDQQTALSTQLGGLAANNVSRVQQAQATPFSYDGMTPLQTSIQGGQLQYGTQNPQAQTNVASGGAIQSTFGTGGPLQSQIASAGNVQGNLNYSGAPALPNSSDFQGAAQQASNSAYAAAASRLDPQYQQQQSDLTSRLANSGISAGSDAYNREMDNFARQKTDAYGQAQNNAYQQGLAAQQQGYGQALSSRQQAVGETTTAGNFANSAQGQIFGQNAQQLAANNAAQGQQYQQNMGAAQFGNTAQDQQYQQNLSNAGFYNQAQSQNFNQAQQNAALNNTTQNQQFNQSASNATLNNQGRQQQIQEAAYLRNMPLNDISALLGTGSGVQNPTFNNVAQVGVAAPDYQGAVYANYNAANQQYNTAMQQKSAGLGSIFGLAGSLGAAAISDVRFKDNIKRIGTLANGLATYTYNYIGNAIQQFGVMAQEAISKVPEAVGTLPNGVMYVDYGKVWNGK